MVYFTAMGVGVLVLPAHLQLLHHANTQHASCSKNTGSYTRALTHTHTHTQNTCCDKVSQCRIILHPLSIYMRSTEQKKVYDLPALVNIT
jgi:hypothetical protein